MNAIDRRELVKEFHRNLKFFVPTVEYDEGIAGEVELTEIDSRCDPQITVIRWADLVMYLTGREV